MIRRGTSLVVALAMLLSCGLLVAQQLSAVTLAVAPIYLRPDARLQPLRTAAIGTRLNVIGTSGEWVNIEFNDPQLGPRVGWVQRKLLQTDADNTTPMDLSAVTSPTSAAPRATAAVPTPYPAASRSGRPRLFIEPIEATDFHVFMAAAIRKKGTPLDVTTDRNQADLVMSASAIEVEKQSAGSKWARCLFMYCYGLDDRANVSVQVVDRAGIVQWSYAVNKGRGQKNKQAMAEAIAKHLKDHMSDRNF